MTKQETHIYKGYVIELFYVDGAAQWCYQTGSELNPDVIWEGEGYSFRQDALEAAMEDIDG